LKANATEVEKQAFKLAEEQYAKEQAAFKVAEADWMASLKQALSKLSPESLKNYDGVIFANTTGDLPIPDKEGFLSWIKAGGAFVGMHSCSDTFHGWPEFIDMLGGEFRTHGAQAGVECMNIDKRSARVGSYHRRRFTCSRVTMPQKFTICSRWTNIRTTRLQGIILCRGPKITAREKCSILRWVIVKMFGMPIQRLRIAPIW
jgi:hypothetical protein